MTKRKSIFSFISRIRETYRSVYPTLDQQSFVGKDLDGNSYYEYCLDDKKSSRNSRQVHYAKVGRIDTKYMSVEWLSWLQHRRKHPPTIEELIQNKKIAEMKKINAEKIAIKEGRPLVAPEPEPKFPSYPEYLKSVEQNFMDYDYYTIKDEDTNSQQLLGKRSIPETSNSKDSSEKKS